MKNFLDSIVDDMTEAFKEKRSREHRSYKPMVFTTASQELLTLMHQESDDDMPSDLWRQRNHVDQRRAAFLNYFVMGHDDDDLKI